MKKGVSLLHNCPFHPFKLLIIQKIQYYSQSLIPHIATYFMASQWKNEGLEKLMRIWWDQRLSMVRPKTINVETKDYQWSAVLSMRIWWDQRLSIVSSAFAQTFEVSKLWRMQEILSTRPYITAYSQWSLIQNGYPQEVSNWFGNCIHFLETVSNWLEYQYRESF